MKKKIALIILDGLGYGRSDASNAIYASNTPFLNNLLRKYPNGTLEASGEFVGLPPGQMGNSEVGHMNLGAGRIVYQELGRLNKAMEDGVFKSHTVLTDAFDYARKKNKNVHFIGLLSDGGVHAHITHVQGLCEAAAAHGLGPDQVFLHAFMDGRDADPLGGISYMEHARRFMATSTAQVASIIGRYYAMDRDKRWERIKKAYDLLVHGTGKPFQNPVQAIQESYDAGLTDEFLEPLIRVDEKGWPITTIKEGDVVISFNFRTDRGREITMALTQQAFAEYEMFPLDLYYLTMTRYDDTFQGVKPIFEKDNINRTLGEVLAEQGKTQVRIAETEKYPHVTFFFSGGRETPFEHEERIMIPSPKVATYDLQPEMSAQGICDAIVENIREKQPDFICLNFANPDMVGHTGMFSAVVKAVETVDHCLAQVVACAKDEGYSCLILADHGNADYMLNEDGSPNTAHTTNLVPVILVTDEPLALRPTGKLGDVAPTILQLMDLPVPAEMTGESLLLENRTGQLRK